MTTTMTVDRIAVRVTGLGKQYRRALGLRAGDWALRDCDFALPAGRVAALVGANGAGKTTLLTVLAGLLAPTLGCAEVDGNVLSSGGKRVDGHSAGGGPVGVGAVGPASAGEGPPGGTPTGRVAFVAQDKPLYRRFTAADMLRWGAHMNSVWDQRRAERWLERFDIPLDRRCGRLSAGQQSQVAFAVAIGSRPSVLLLDEPLSALDPLARREVTQELLAEVNDTGMTVLLSTHVVTELGGVADHLLLLAHGRLLTGGDLDTLLDRHVRYLGPRADAPPGPGTVLQASHSERNTNFLVRLSDEDTYPTVAEPWVVRPVTLEEFVLAYLSATRRSEPEVTA